MKKLTYIVVLLIASFSFSQSIQEEVLLIRDSGIEMAEETDSVQVLVRTKQGGILDGEMKWVSKSAVGTTTDLSNYYTKPEVDVLYDLDKTLGNGNISSNKLIIQSSGLTTGDITIGGDSDDLAVQFNLINNPPYTATLNLKSEKSSITPDTNVSNDVFLRMKNDDSSEEYVAYESYVDAAISENSNIQKVLENGSVATGITTNLEIETPNVMLGGTGSSLKLYNAGTLELHEGAYLKGGDNYDGTKDGFKMVGSGSNLEVYQGSDNLGSISIANSSRGILINDAGFSINAASGTGYILPNSRGTNNQVLQTDGSGNVAWQTIANGSVTSVGMTVPTGLTISGSPITTSGTFDIGLQSGYSIPTTANQTNWGSAYTYSQVGHIPLSQKGANSGVATLDAGGKLPASQIGVTSSGGMPYYVSGVWGQLVASAGTTSNSVAVRTGTGALQGSTAMNAADLTRLDQVTTLTGNQTVAGVKTFSSSPIVPTATLSGQAVNLGQLNSGFASLTAENTFTQKQNFSERITVDDIVEMEQSAAYTYGYTLSNEASIQATNSGFAFGVTTGTDERKSFQFMLQNLTPNVANNVIIPAIGSGSGGNTTMVTTSTLDGLVETYLKSLSGYNASTVQVLGHDASGNLEWQAP